MYAGKSMFTNIVSRLAPNRKLDQKMIHFKRDRAINATPEAVWSVLGNYMQIDEFAPQITSVDALTSGEIGIGSQRRNHFENGTSLVEEVIEWEPMRGYTVKLSDMDAMPLVEASSSVSITPTGEGSLVSWSFDYKVKYGPFGWLLGQTMMKMMMGKIIDANLKGLADKVEASNQT